MEYVFGMNDDMEILKTKGANHSDLSGVQIITREYPDQIIYDRFKIVKKYSSKEDCEGNCYDWYEIAEHSRSFDKSPAANAKLEKTNALIQYVAMMADIDIPEEGDDCE